MTDSGVRRRAKRALERQLEYQQRKADSLRGQEQQIMESMARRSAAIHDRLSAVQPIARDARVLEVGSGAHGLIFYFDGGERIGIDPLADHYRQLFPAWQDRVLTIAGFGEQLPFEDASFDVVLSDNVVDHAESPRRIVEEMARVLKPGGLMYFTVNIHHPLYHVAASIHAGWRALGIPFEITPFADHTVHLTLKSAKALFDGLPLRVVEQSDTIDRARREGRSGPARHAGDWLKRFFFKNALFELIAVKQDQLAPTSRAP